MCDSKEMYEVLVNNQKIDSQIINDKIHFINQLTDHRNLKINFRLIEPETNLATEHLSTNNETSASRDSRDFV